jgi:hypothetical protein
MAMLLKRCIQGSEPFVTYQNIRDELQYQLGIDTIFPLHIGHVAGSLMDQIFEMGQILKIARKAPLINALVTRSSGIPGNGIGNYFADRYKIESYRNWKKMPSGKKREIVNRERIKIMRYTDWEELNKELFGSTALSKLRIRKGTEIDGFSPNGQYYGGPAESEEHKKLKDWVAAHPQKIGLRKSFFRKGTPESPLPSGDTVDVLFEDGNEFVTVEVKSCRSNDEDFRRGIYQCVKYREVKEAQQFPHKVKVRTLLVTERNLSSELKTRARDLDVRFKCVSVNNRRSGMSLN